MAKITAKTIKSKNKDIMPAKVGRPRKYATAEDFEKAVNDYFDSCDKRGAPYTIEGLAYACNIDRKTVVNYSNDEELFPIVKRARERILAQLSELAISGKGNAACIIFNLKNNYGYRDKQETELSGTLSFKSLEDFYNEA